MAAHVSSRKPFAVLDSPRLQNLTNTKNRQNSIPSSDFSFASPSGKQLSSSPSKRRLAPTFFDDDHDSENVDPALSDSPTKRVKSLDGSPKKPSKFILNTIKPDAPSSSRLSTPLVPTAQKASSAPTTAANSISTSRGSPKHKRVGLLSKRRTSGSPYTRVDPPSFGLGRPSKRTSGLPFSIDAAISGSISSPASTPKAAKARPASSEVQVPTLEESMPKSWFFEIHEDTPEQEATNLMEHSTNILDISSNDDSDTKSRNETREKGKENIPPPDYCLTSSRSASDGEAAADESVKSKLRRKLEENAMDEDRSPLSDLPASDYFGEGLDANSHVIVDGIAPEKGSSLSKECKFDDSESPSDESENPAVADEGPEEAPDAHDDASSSDSKSNVAEPLPEKEEFVVFDENAVAPESDAAK
ncbi:uncharacterized protein J3D65DRAFT_611083 [Phyllosticta citribraziliensis]|uniref:Thymidylate kinase n=1 Tax=Phyllosticta citribraziliensis TaxID=989973 RepID=A0ABR1MAJ3_9PEZI